MPWQLQEAKNRLSEATEAANGFGRQVVTVRARRGAYCRRTSSNGIDSDLLERGDHSDRDQLS